MNSSSILAPRTGRIASCGISLSMSVLLACCAEHSNGASAHTPSVQELTFQMRVDDFAARERAGSSLRSAGAAAVPQLLALLHAQDSTLTKLLIAHGAEELTTPAFDWHAYAASALGEIGPPAASAIPDLVAASGEVLTGVSPEHRDFVTTRARAALIKIRQEPLDELEHTLSDPRAQTWSNSLEIAQELGVYGRPLVPVLARMIKDLDCPQRYRVVNALGRIDGAAEASTPALLAALADEDDAVRWFALRVLRPTRAPSRELLDAVAARLADPKPAVRQQAIETLASIVPADRRRACAIQLEPLTRDAFAEVRASAQSRIDELRR